MRKQILTCLFLVFGILNTIVAFAEIKLPAIVSSNMVLQRNATVTLWGWSAVDEKISIKTSWVNETLNVKGDKNGKWSIEVKTTLSKVPQTITLKSLSSNIILNNVLFGEVWLCSGQSNMQQPVGGFTAQPVFGSNIAIAKSSNPNLRLFTVDRVGSKTPLDKLVKYEGWQEASPENVSSFSAVGYFFGAQLQETLGVPVGIIHSSWGASFVEAWMSKESLEKYQKIDLEKADMKISNRVQTALFNAMINPLIPYTIKGALWYQGEANRTQPDEYKNLFPEMVKDWRLRWGIGDFPFYYAQIAPFTYNDCNSAFFREAQLNCLDIIPNSGMAITLDIGAENVIHPPQKKEVADRLLFYALHQTYGYGAVDCDGPRYKSAKIEDGEIILSFEHATQGLYAYDGLKGFEIAGEDKIFYPAEAKIIKNNQVKVKSNQVIKPVAVRYAWKSWIVGTLYNNRFLPASSFRTDTWDDDKKAQN